MYQYTCYYCVIIIQVVISLCGLQTGVVIHLFLFVDLRPQLRLAGKCQYFK